MRKRSERRIAPKGASASDRLAFHSMPVTECGCFIWMGPVCTSSGYGQMNINYRVKQVHRLAWELQNGAIPAGLFVLHRCDVRTCVNPDHLFVGSHKENMRDMKLKGRSASGERSPKAKLTSQNVYEIRSSGQSQSELAAEYGVCPATISHIKTGKNWSLI